MTRRERRRRANYVGCVVCFQALKDCRQRCPVVGGAPSKPEDLRRDRVLLAPEQPDRRNDEIGQRDRRSVGGLGRPAHEDRIVEHLFFSQNARDFEGPHGADIRRSVVIVVVAAVVTA